MENLGYLSLLLAFCVSIYAIASALVGKLRAKPFLEASAQRAVLAVWMLVTVSSAILIYHIFTDDFRLSYVAQVSNRDLAPVSNFAAWWAIGLGMAIVVRWALCRPDQPPATSHQRPADTMLRAQPLMFYVLRFAFLAIPACLYLLNTLMFAAINLSRGYTLAGIIGAGVLVVFTVSAIAVAKTNGLRAISRDWAETIDNSHEVTSR